jgi:vacuole morphology and inheritance protein 14
VQLYEKRKLAALEVEQLVKQLATQGNTRRIEEVIDLLVSAYATSSQVGPAVGRGVCSAHGCSQWVAGQRCAVQCRG